MTVRVGLNGFGRTGRAFTRAVIGRKMDVDIVAVNDLGAPETLARLLARDSVHGPLHDEVKVTDGRLLVDGLDIALRSERDPATLPWGELGVDIVVEATGKFTARDQAAVHLEGGASHVIVSAPSKGADATFVLGVNEASFDPRQHRVVSNASCTTNCLVPMIKVLDDAFGIEQGFMTTIHAYTGDQQLVDGPHKDARRARAAGLNIVPTSTGAARATSMVIESMLGRLDGLSVRVPVADGSLTDLVVVLAGDASAEDINAAFRQAAGQGPLAGILEYSEDDLVSTDIVGSAASCVFDSKLTMASGRLAKVFGWYDNEWGYANRLAELTNLVGSAV